MKMKKAHLRAEDPINNESYKHQEAWELDLLAVLSKEVLVAAGYWQDMLRIISEAVLPIASFRLLIAKGF
jgi:hypothetical protein